MSQPDFSLEITDEVFPIPETPSPIHAIPESIAASSLGGPRLRSWSKSASRVAFWSAAVIPVTAGLAVAATLYGTRSSRSVARGLLVGSAVWGVGMGLFRWQAQRVFTDQPAYTVVKRVGALEIRKYPAMVMAETTAYGGSWKEGVHEGFQRLFRFIQGENIDSESIEMTTPVATREDRGQSLPMGAPVSVRRSDSSACTVGFIMPAGRSAAQLPKPLDTRIQLVTHPARKVAALVFRDSLLDGAVARKKANELIARVETLGLSVRGEPSFAGYDPPTTLPFLRRQEAWVEVT